MRRLTTTLVRTAVLVLLALAVAGVDLPARSAARHWVFLLDISAGIPEHATGDGLSIDDARAIIDHHRKTLPAGDVATLLLFGKNCATDESAVDRVGTDIAGAIATALALPDDGLQREIVIFTDGNATAGDLDAVLRSAARADVRVHTIPLGRPRAIDAAIVDIRAPSSVKSGQSFDAGITIRSSVAGRMKLRLLKESGETVSAVDIALESGERKTILMPGTAVAADARFRAVVEPAFADECPRNNTAPFAVSALAERTRILYLAGRQSSPTTIELLRQNPAFDLTPSSAWTDPTPFNAVVLDAFDCSALSRRQMDDFRAFVETLGGGILFLGGPASFASGGLAGTPVEAVSPLRAFPDEKISVAFLLDVSGSMNGTIPTLGQSKLAVAKEAIVASLRILREDDAIGLIAFADAAERLAPLAPRKDPATFVTALQARTANGKTSILPAVEAAAAMLADAATARRRVILLTDGMSEGDVATFTAMGKTLRERHLPITTIAVGNEIDREKLLALCPAESDMIVLANLADLAATIEGVLVRSKDLILEEPSPMAVTVVEPTHAILSGITAIPPIGRINRTARKEGTDVLLAVRENPLLAVRRCGNGWSAAFASNLLPGWEGGFGSWRETYRLLNQIVMACAAPRPTDDVDIGVTRDGDAMIVTVVDRRGTAQRPLKGDWRNAESGDEGTLEFHSTGIDRQSARIPHPAEGAYRLRIGDGERVFRHAFNILYPGEFAAVGVNRQMVERITSATGGDVTADIDRLKSTGIARVTTTDGAPYFLLAAVIFFIIDILITTFWK